jgi:hypothetical protein
MVHLNFLLLPLPFDLIASVLTAVFCCMGYPYTTPSLSNFTLVEIRQPLYGAAIYPETHHIQTHSPNPICDMTCTAGL